MSISELPPLKRLALDSLSKNYPVSHRRVLERVFLWGTGVLFAAMLYYYVEHRLVGASGMSNDAKSMLLGSLWYLLAALFVAFVLKFIYEEIYRWRYFYGIDAGHLIISRGILLRHRGVFPLNRIADIYMDRGIWDVFFGLYNLHIVTPARHSERFGSINGLSRSTAQKLQQLIAEVIAEHQQQRPRDTQEPSRQELRVIDENLKVAANM